jgi:hypothetical protein
VLKHLGHSYPSSAAPYLIATDEDVEEQQGDLIDIFIDPYIERRGKNKCLLNGSCGNAWKNAELPARLK